MANCFEEHLRECAVKVIEGLEFYDETHPYCFDRDFIIIMIEELDKKRLACEQTANFEHCAVYRDVIRELTLLVQELTETVA